MSFFAVSGTGFCTYLFRRPGAWSLYRDGQGEEVDLWKWCGDFHEELLLPLLCSQHSVSRTQGESSGLWDWSWPWRQRNRESFVKARVQCSSPSCVHRREANWIHQWNHVPPPKRFTHSNAERPAFFLKRITKHSSWYLLEE